MKNITFKFHSDSRHGWLAVKKQYLIDLNIEKGISSFSYKNGNTVYLEEDSDAIKFIIAFEKKFNQSPKIVELKSKDHSHIRSFERYNEPLTPFFIE